MIDSLKIKGFKLFRDFELPKLARLNLFVGTNNAGKSCLLEAVRLYVNLINGNQSILPEMVRLRDGDWELNIATRDPEREEAPTVIENPIRFLFNDFHYEKDPSAVIEIGPIDDGGLNLRLSSGLYRQVREENVLPKWVQVEREDAAATSEEVEEMLEIRVGDNRRLVSADRLWSRRSFLREQPSTAIGSKPITIVGASGIEPAKVGVLWDQVSIAPQQSNVLDCLALIKEPKIEALALVGDSSSYRNGAVQRIPVVRIRGSEERFPLKSMGDGLTRLFHIALAMVNAQHGVILIDEFENGLYWEVLEQLWPVIFRMAEELDVQVFATTHSRDCMVGFANAWGQEPSLGTMYRLERTESSVNAFSLPVQNLQDALASHVEVR